MLADMTQLAIDFGVDRIGASTPRAQRGGGGASPTSTLQRLTPDRVADVADAGKSWQRLVREQRRDPNPPPALSSRALATAWVHPVAHQTAQRFIERYEWLGTMPAIAMHCFGIFFDGRCGGVVVYGTEYAENLGVWDRYGFGGRLLLLARGACAHWTPVGTASRLIRRSMRFLPTVYEVITATVDQQAGEYGTIYQACGFHYVGAMSTGRAAWWRIDGKVWTERMLRDAMGVGANRDTIPARFPNAERIVARPKGRYFAFRGSPGVRARHLAAINHLLRPYPKRQNHADECVETR